MRSGAGCFFNELKCRFRGNAGSQGSLLQTDFFRLSMQRIEVKPHLLK